MCILSQFLKPGGKLNGQEHERRESFKEVSQVKSLKMRQDSGMQHGFLDWMLDHRRETDTVGKQVKPAGHLCTGG